MYIFLFAIVFVICIAFINSQSTNNKQEDKIEYEEMTSGDSILDWDYDYNKGSFYELYSASIGGQLAIQRALGKYVTKDFDWNIDFRSKIITFGENSYPINFIGSASNVDDTWLWAYENINNFDASLIELAHEVRDQAQQFGCPELLTPKIKLEGAVDAHALATVCSAILDGKFCYYLAKHDQGSAAVLLENIPDIVFKRLDTTEFTKIALEIIANHDVDHRIFIEGFLHWNQAVSNFGEKQIIAKFDDNDDHQLQIDFEIIDGQSRITRVGPVTP